LFILNEQKDILAVYSSQVELARAVGVTTAAIAITDNILGD
jgi:hypothetical protein